MKQLSPFVAITGIIKKIKSLLKQRGFWLSLVISLSLLLYYYGPTIQHLNHYYFATEGDGLISYFHTGYHIEHDPGFSYFNGMNYPYGDQVLFTNGHTLLAAIIKFIRPVADFSAYTVGLINFIMLFSLILAAVLIYLIFLHLKVNQYFAALAAVGIVFLSPQLMRFPGHFTLSYAFVIPGILYLLIKYYKRPSLRTSILIGIYGFILSLFHLYNFAITAFITGLFWLMNVLADKQYRRFRVISVNILIQVVLPYLLLNTWLFFTDHNTDRTSYPWGLYDFRSGWEAIFLHARTVGEALESSVSIRPIQWEGWSFIGHVAVVVYFFTFTLFAWIPFISAHNALLCVLVFLLGLVLYFIVLKKNKQFLMLSNNRLLNIFLWTAFASLLFSFGWPFVLNWEMVKYIPVIKQFRSLGRFAWIFYYVINIYAFYFLYHLSLKKYLKLGILILSLTVLYYDAITYANTLPALTTTIPELEDTQNMLAQNQWINDIETDHYQAIVVLPYFHVGSENLWIEAKCDCFKTDIIASMKTGLPSVSTLLSRTSIGQTFKIVQLFKERYRTPDILQDFPNQKPFLILAMDCDEMNDTERYLINRSRLLASNHKFSVRELSFETIATMADSLNLEKEAQMNAVQRHLIDGFSSTSPTKDFVYQDFNLTSFSQYKYRGEGGYIGRITDYNVVYEGRFPADVSGLDFVVSFWLNHSRKDLYPRSTVELIVSDSNNTVYQVDYHPIGPFIKTIDRDWSLVEYNVVPDHPKSRLKITIFNHDLFDRDTLNIDELLIRPVTTDLYKIQRDGELYYNNRYYPWR